MKFLLFLLSVLFGLFLVLAKMDPSQYRDTLKGTQIDFFKGLTVPFEPEVPESNVEGDMFDVSFYCSCPTCCGKNSPERGGHGLTASGKPPKEGETIAADWSVLPKGSKVDIEGFGTRTVMDTGSAIKGKKIDIFMKSHEEAKKAGRKQLRVKRLK
jgi:3D (Asp-Asp-Asp) domain-containing protein